MNFETKLAKFWMDENGIKKFSSKYRLYQFLTDRAENFKEKDELLKYDITINVISEVQAEFLVD